MPHQGYQNRPLYKGIEEYCHFLEKSNAGLFYDKFCNTWRTEYNEDWGRDKWTLTPPPASKDGGPKVAWIETVKDSAVGDNVLLGEMQKRQIDLLASRGQQPLLYQTAGPFVTGLGRNHPVENGFCWHHQLGVPYLPGSSVKGLVRNWIEIWDDKYRDNLSLWFGSKEKEKAPRQAGGFIFLDALPVAKVRVGIDILTPHMGQYYAKGGADPGTPETKPADWHDPVPSPFLVVKQATFSFGIIPRTEDFARCLVDVAHCLNEALNWLGAGAKTAVGYGRMSIDEKAHEKLRLKKLSPAERLREEVGKLTEKQLVTMFGAGINLTRKEFGKRGEWNDFVRFVYEIHGPQIETWKDENIFKNKQKACKKFSAALRALNDDNGQETPDGQQK